MDIVVLLKRILKRPKTGKQRVEPVEDGYEVDFEAFMAWMNSSQGRAITVKMEEAHGTY